MHIRSVLTKAELESLPVEGRVKEDAEKGKVRGVAMASPHTLPPVVIKSFFLLLFPETIFFPVTYFFIFYLSGLLPVYEDEVWILRPSRTAVQTVQQSRLLQVPLKGRISAGLEPGSTLEGKARR